MLAAEGGHTEVAAQLLEAGTPWNALDREGHCAGDLAMRGGHQATIDLLLDAGAHCSLASHMHAHLHCVAHTCMGLAHGQATKPGS